MLHKHAGYLLCDVGQVHYPSRQCLSTHYGRRSCGHSPTQDTERRGGWVVRPRGSHNSSPFPSEIPHAEGRKELTQLKRHLRVAGGGRACRTLSATCCPARVASWSTWRRSRFQKIFLQLSQQRAKPCIEPRLGLIAGDKSNINILSHGPA